MTSAQSLSQLTGTFEIAGKSVARLGFGAMRLTGDGIWGEPADRKECVRVVRRAVELGVQLIDTADSYGPGVSEDVIREAIHPYPDDVLIATKAGLVRHGPNIWASVGRPEYLRQQVEMSLRRLGLDRIDLFQLHRIDENVPLADQAGLLKELVDEGKVGAVGLSEVTTDQLDEVRKTVEVATVQNRYNLAARDAEDVVDYCVREAIGFIPWAPIASGDLAEPGGPVDELAQKHDASWSQIALAWLLGRAQVILPIPGTSTVAHLEENMGAAQVQLTRDEIDELTLAR
jgi:pyridoxine 4-dehydrogenase